MENQKTDREDLSEYFIDGVGQSHESFVLTPHDLALLTCKDNHLEARQRQQAYLSSRGIGHGI